MARNLREKIHAILNDSYDIRRESVVTKIENLIKEELSLKEEERQLNYQDVSFIQSVAARNFVDRRTDEGAIGKMAGDQPMIRTLCMFDAVVSFLRSKGLLSATFIFKK